MLSNAKEKKQYLNTALILPHPPNTDYSIINTSSALTYFPLPGSHENPVYSSKLSWSI